MGWWNETLTGQSSSKNSGIEGLEHESAQLFDTSAEKAALKKSCWSGETRFLRVNVKPKFQASKGWGTKVPQLFETSAEIAILIFPIQ